MRKLVPALLLEQLELAGSSFPFSSSLGFTFISLSSSSSLLPLPSRLTFSNRLRSPSFLATQQQQHTMTSRIAAVAFLSTLLFASKVSAIGDFPCFGTGITQSCLAWSTAAGAGGPISPTADCLPGSFAFPPFRCSFPQTDPTHPQTQLILPLAIVVTPIRHALKTSIVTMVSFRRVFFWGCFFWQAIFQPLTFSLKLGSCQGGTCRGYLGDACASSLDCQAYFFCGTDGVCGGGAA